MTENTQALNMRSGRLSAISEYFPAVAVGFLLTRTLTGELVFGLAAIALTFAYCTVRFDDRSSNRAEYLTFSLLVSLIFIVAVGNSEATNFRSLYYFMTFFASTIIAIYFLHHPFRAYLTSQAAMFAFFGWFVATGLVKGFGPVDINSFIPDGSRNAVSMLAVLLQIFHCTAFYREKGRLPVIAPALTIIVTALCFGRSSLAIAAVLLLLCAVQNTAWWMTQLRFTKALKHTIYAISLVVVVSLVVLVIAERPYGWAGGLATQRWLLIGSYLQEITPLTFLTGVPLSEVPLISRYTDNPHNSFVRGHSYFGVSYLLVLAAIFTIVVAGCSKQQWVLVSLTTLGLVRVFSDTFALPGNFDFALLLPLFGILAHVIDQTRPSLFKSD